MLRRLAVPLALVAFLTSSGLTLCPSGGCPLVRQAKSDCCTKGAGVKRPDCCPSAAEHGSPWLESTPAADRFAAPQAWLAPGWSLPPTQNVWAEGRLPASAARGPSPPATLLTQQTSLLL
jgi:hypothetical protein